MQTTREVGRKVALALTVAGTAVFGLSNEALACGAEYTVSIGDTLSRIAAKCDASLSALVAANDVDPHALQIGQVLTIPGADIDEPVVRESSKLRPETTQAQGRASEFSETGYAVRAGDTLSGIARTLGISASTLLEANPGLDPHRLRIGQRLNVPDDEEVRRILAERRAAEERLERMQAEYPNPVLHVGKGEWRRTVELHVTDLAPGESVRVGISADGREWLTLGDAAADKDGVMTAKARIPAALHNAGALKFAVQRSWGDTVALAYDGRRLPAIQQARAPRNQVLTIVGKIVRGGGCNVLVTPHGDSFALAGDVRVRPGERVVVTGSTRSARDGCVGGHAELEVENINPMPQSG